MKMSILLIIICTTSLFAGNSYSQDAMVSLSLINVNIRDVFTEIEKQSDYRFFYNENQLDVEKKVNIQSANNPISEVLNDLFSNTDIAYKVVDKYIVLVSMKAYQNELESKNNQQQKVTGRVIDATTGEPLPGVNIQIKGTQQGTITDADGEYSFNVLDASAVLVFSYIGYISEEIQVYEKSVIDISMAMDITNLEEVIVVGYGVQKKSSVTGSISQVKSEDMSNRTITSAEQALQGKTSGVQVVTTSGTPGSSPSIRVRGYSSNSDMSPLFVVDGILVSDINNIEPNDIQSIEVLKDASSAAIYGAQAGNGVILITTKRGADSKEGWGKISYNFLYSSQSIASTPRLMNAQEYSEYMVEGGLFSQSTMDTYWDGITNTDWIDAVFSNSTMKKHSLSFSNGSEKGTFYTSISYLDNDGIQVGDKDVYRRLNGMINADYKIKPWFKLLTANSIERNTLRSGGSGVMGDVFLMDPLTPVTYKESDLPANMQSVLNSGKTILQDENGDYYSISNFYAFANPLASLNKSTTKEESFDVIGNIASELTPIKGLTITSKFGYKLGSSSSNTYNNDYYASSQIYNDYVTVSQSNSTTLNYQWDNYVNYLRTFGDKHDISAMFGHSFIKNTYYSTTGGLTANGENAVLADDPDLFGWLDYASGSATKTNSGGKEVTSSESYFGRLNYSYAGKYMAQFSYRADAFDLSRLPITNRWGYFPAGSVAWVVSSENFWNIVPKQVNYLKMRGSWGKNGSIGPLEDYKYATTMASGSKYSFGNDTDYNYITSSAPSTMGNDNLTWETSTQFDLGFDARFLNNRLTTTFDWFNKKTDDLLVSELEPSLIAGGTFSAMNAGSVSNKGIEIEIGWESKLGNDFRYGIRTNASTLKNKVTYLNKGIDYIIGTKLLNDPVTIFEEGYEVWHFYGYQFTGIDPENGEPLFEDINEDGSITTEDRTNLGSAIPNLTYGVTLTAAYKGFDLIIFGSGTQGSDIYQCLFSNDRTSGNRIYDEYYKDRWTNSNTNGTRPAASADISKYIVSSAMVKDGSFFRIKQIQLGYTLPQSLSRKFLFTNLRMYVSLDDWFLFTKYNGFDPEASSSGTKDQQGVDKAVYPISRKFAAGLNITF